MTRTTEVQEFVRRAAEWVKQVQSGDEVLLTQDSQPVARLVPTSPAAAHPPRSLRLPKALPGRWVGAAVLDTGELAEEMFARE
jgi:prevent-host-death family protein